MINRLCLLAVTALWSVSVTGQELPFWEEVMAYKKQDSLNMPAPGATLFVGSSSIRLWDNLATSFPQHRVINRGFGGSTLEDLMHYLDDLVIPYQAKQIIIYCGENDIASGKVTAEETLERFKKVLAQIRESYPQTSVLFISLKPSPSRIQYLQQMKEANKFIKDFIDSQPHTQFVDVFNPMLDGNQQPLRYIFAPDQLHMNEKGYAIWTEVLEPYLVN